MAVLAACGLIYQYLLSHYAGRVLGMMEHAIYIMIGVMIVSMGIGAFLAKYFSKSETAFAFLEMLIALLGAISLFIIGGAFAFSLYMPLLLSETFAIPLELLPDGGFVQELLSAAKIMPFVIGFLIGVLIGMEIPFIARIRQRLYGAYLEHNVGTIYGADYLGAGIGAAIFILWMLSMDPNKAVVLTASVNFMSGLVFYLWQYRFIEKKFLLNTLVCAVIIVLIMLGRFGGHWQEQIEAFFYKDPVVASIQTPFQHVTITESIPRQKGQKPILSLFINGRTQFTSKDEFIYHDFLVQPALLASYRRKKVLIIGGGDGLALRDVLEWSPEEVFLVDLDEDLVSYFAAPIQHPVENRLIALNKNAFADPRVTVKFGDAFNVVDDLRVEGHFFDTIIVDLPDPSHPDLNKLYSVSFYAKLHNLLSQDGALVVQSTSPYHAAAAFLTVGVTVKAAGFKHVDRYHANVPSFGEWGWTIATKAGKAPKQRLQEASPEIPEPHWVSKEQLIGAFAFQQHFFDDVEKLTPNTKENGLIYQLHQKAWMVEESAPISSY